MLAEKAARHETRNATILALNFVLGRIGWIFKTESVIVPAFVDAVSGAGWVRGLLPIVNRVFQSLPPFLLAGVVKRTKSKKWIYFGSSLAMSLPFGAMGLVLLSFGEANAPGQLEAGLVELRAGIGQGAVPPAPGGNGRP